MKTIQTALLLTAVLSYSLSATAQVTPLEKATNAMGYKDFRAAMPLLESVLAEDPTNVEALSKVAKCYQVTYHLSEAASSYEQLMPLAGVSPEDVFAYGQVLMQLGKYGEAAKRFKEYAQANPELGNYFSKSAQIAEETRHTDANYTVKNASFNSSAADFGTAFYKENQIIFTSTREPGEVRGKIGTPARLFITTENEKGGFDAVKLEKRAINEKESEGPASFTETGEKAVFARNNIKNGTTPLPNGGMKQDLFIGNLKGVGMWDMPKSLDFNGTEYSTAYPFISPDGKVIYFASDMPGGLGGYDLYKTEKLNGKWTAPVNLGESVNTAGDEITPFVEGDILYFSSNWYEGYGGFDVFETNLKEENSAISNLGTAINSPGDDFSFVFNSEKNKGFLTSNRQGGKGMEDIYTVVRDAVVQPIVEASNPPVTKNKIEKTSPKTSTTVDDLVASAASAADDLGDIKRTKVEEYKQTTTPKGSIVGHILDLATNDPVEGVLVTLENKSDKSLTELSTKTDRNGQYSLPLLPNTRYAVHYSKASYVDDTRALNTGEKVFIDLLGYSRLRPGVFNPNAKLLPAETAKIVKKVDIGSPVKETVEKVVETAPAVVEEVKEVIIPTAKVEVETSSVAIEEAVKDIPANVETIVQVQEVEKSVATTTETAKATETPKEAVKELVVESPKEAVKEMSLPPETKGEVFEIHVANTKSELSAANEALLRKHGSLYKSQSEGIFTYRLGYYDNVACATTTRDKVRELGYPSATVSAKQVNAKDNISRMRLMLGRQKASCPTDRPGVAPPVDLTVKEDTKTATPEYSASTQPKTGISQPKKKEVRVYSTDPEEGEVRDPDPTAGLNTEGYIYFLQLGSFDPKKKISFKKIEALKLGKITQSLNSKVYNVNLLVSFNTKEELYKARQLVIETGEVTDPFLRTYDKDGILVTNQ